MPKFQFGHQLSKASWISSDLESLPVAIDQFVKSTRRDPSMITKIEQEVGEDKWIKVYPIDPPTPTPTPTQVWQVSLLSDHSNFNAMCGSVETALKIACLEAEKLVLDADIGYVPGHITRTLVMKMEKALAKRIKLDHTEYADVGDFSVIIQAHQLIS